MSKTLGGSIIVRDAIKYDYCIAEAIESLYKLCDRVVILDAGSTDGTFELITKLEAFASSSIIVLPPNVWDEYEGREKLSYFTNMAMNVLDCDWNINLQADECIHEDSFDAIREAIEDDSAEGYWCRRYNLWATSKFYVDVDASRKPVGDEIIRLCKKGYWSINDAQSLHCPEAKWDYIDKIRIYHAGFIRDKYKHIPKIENMLVNVFGMGMDEKVKAMTNGFDPFVHFSKEDLKPIIEPLPIFMQEWAAERDRINGVEI